MDALAAPSHAGVPGRADRQPLVGAVPPTLVAAVAGHVAGTRAGQEPDSAYRVLARYDGPASATSA